MGAGVVQVTRDFSCDDITVNLGDVVQLMDSELIGDFATVRDALGNVGSVPSHCIRVHL